MRIKLKKLKLTVGEDVVANEKRPVQIPEAWHLHFSWANRITGISLGVLYSSGK